jgi:hypothetical protein
MPTYPPQAFFLPLPCVLLRPGVDKYNKNIDSTEKFYRNLSQHMNPAPTLTSPNATSIVNKVESLVSLWGGGSIPHKASFSLLITSPTPRQNVRFHAKTRLTGSFSHPVTPFSHPVGPSSKPVEPSNKSVEPSNKSVEPSNKPVEPSSKPVEPSNKSVEPSSKPVEPSNKSVEPSNKPVDRSYNLFISNN